MQRQTEQVEVLDLSAVPVGPSTLSLLFDEGNANTDVGGLEHKACPSPCECSRLQAHSGGELLGLRRVT